MKSGPRLTDPGIHSFFAFAVGRGACERVGVNPAVLPFLMLAIFAGVIGLVAVLAARQSKLAAENVRRMAEALGLEYAGRAPVLGLFYTDARAFGQLRGRRVELFPFATGSGKSRTQWCAVSAAVSAGGLTFHLRRQGMGTKVMELFGAREIQVGDAEFDAAWFIQTSAPDLFAAALLPELRDKITRLVRELGGQARGMEFKLEDGAVRYAEMGAVSSGDICARCQRAADIICDLAEVAEAAAGTAR